MRCQIAVIALLFLISCAKPVADTRPSLVYYDKNGKSFNFTQVEVKFQPPAPEYPHEAKALGIQGTVIVMIYIDREGVPFKTIVRSGPPELRSSAEAFAMKWRFLPALESGMPLATIYTLSVPYKLN